MMTSFTRIIIVLSILRHALGLQQTPPNQVLVGLSLFLSLFVMAPVISEVNRVAIPPYGEEQIDIGTAVSRSGDALHGSSEARSVGNEWVCKCRVRWSPNPYTKKKTK